MTGRLRGGYSEIRQSSCVCYQFTQRVRRLLDLLRHVRVGGRDGKGRGRGRSQGGTFRVRQIPWPFLVPSCQCRMQFGMDRRQEPIHQKNSLEEARLSFQEEQMDEGREEMKRDGRERNHSNQPASREGCKGRRNQVEGMGYTVPRSERVRASTEH